MYGLCIRGKYCPANERLPPPLFRSRSQWCSLSCFHYVLSRLFLVVPGIFQDTLSTVPALVSDPLILMVLRERERELVVTYSLSTPFATLFYINA